MGIRLRCARRLMGREEVKIAIVPSSLTHLLYVQVSGPFLVPYLFENDHFRIPPNTLCSPPKALSTLPRCPRNASIDSRPHYRFNAFSTVLTRTSENAPVIFSVTVFISIRFLSSTLLQMYAFSFWSLSRAFSNWFVSNGNTLVHCVQILYKTLFGGGGWGANRVYYGNSKIENTHRDF